MITSENIVNHELIGLDTTVITSTNPQIVGLSGKIVDETKSMFVLETGNGLKSIPKSISQWEFELDGKKITLNGVSLLRRSYERVGVKA